MLGPKFRIRRRGKFLCSEFTRRSGRWRGFKERISPCPRRSACMLVVFRRWPVPAAKEQFVADDNLFATPPRARLSLVLLCVSLSEPPIDKSCEFSSLKGTRSAGEARGERFENRRSHGFFFLTVERVRRNWLGGSPCLSLSLVLPQSWRPDARPLARRVLKEQQTHLEKWCV